MLKLVERKSEPENAPEIVSWLHDFLAEGAVFTTGDGGVLLGIGEATPSAAAHESKLCLYHPDFFLRASQPYLCFSKSLTLSSTELQLILERFPSEGNLAPTAAWSEPDYLDYKRKFESLKALIHEGRLQKGVPSSSTHNNCGPLSPAEICAVLLNGLAAITANFRVGTGPYLFGCWNRQSGMIGLTPEQLFTLSPEARQITTGALAATRPSGAGNNLSLDAKECKEHQIVIQGITESLEKFGTVTVDTTKEVSVPGLIHLHAELRCQCSGENPTFEETVRALHPTPALGIYPKNGDSTWLDTYEADRTFYGAPVAAIQPESNAPITAIVAIRSLFWNGTSRTIRAGGGVVAESSLEKEWGEVQNKLRAIREALGI